MSAADELADLRKVLPGWGDSGEELAPTTEALHRAEVILTGLAANGHFYFSAFPVDDGGVDLQHTDKQKGMIVLEIAPSGGLRDLTLTHNDRVVHAPAEEWIAQINTWWKP